jgi:hypothetical protein
MSNSKLFLILVTKLCSLRTIAVSIDIAAYQEEEADRNGDAAQHATDLWPEVHGTPTKAWVMIRSKTTALPAWNHSVGRRSTNRSKSILIYAWSGELLGLPTSYHWLDRRDLSSSHLCSFDHQLVSDLHL